MKLIDMQVKDYLEVLKSDAPAPGGGSVSALAGAQGVGLFMMVADLTLGKEKYADYQEICREAKEKGMALYEELTEAIDKDTEAFNLVAAAFKMPKLKDRRLPESRPLLMVHWYPQKYRFVPCSWARKDLCWQRL